MAMAGTAKKEKKKGAKETPYGTIRIKTSDLKPYIKARKSWKRCSKEFPEAMGVIELFRAHDKFNILIDKKNPEFLKGELSPDGKIKGARIKVLPDGEELDKAYPLLAKHLTVHSESSHHHWDVIYENPCGKYAYLYTLEKKKGFVRKKYLLVDEFEKYYPKLKRNVYRALRNGNDHLALPMYTLLKTYMRIGNEIYYKAHGHKGLTTLKKKDIKIKGSYVSFNYIAKDGVPINIMEKFPHIYILRLQRILKSIKKTDFVFINSVNSHPLHENHFKEAFKRYCGREFYPHIVRSFYATEKVKEFLKTRKSPTKDEIRVLFLSIAEKLGHKRYDKNGRVWKEHYNVTINHYIQPGLVRHIKSIAK